MNQSPPFNHKTQRLCIRISLWFAILMLLQFRTAALCADETAPRRSNLDVPALIKGLSYLRYLPPVKLGVNFRSSYFSLQAAVSVNSPEDARLMELEARLERASDEQRRLLQLQIEQLKILAESIRASSEYQRKMLDHQARVFEYQQGVLRKERYDVPTDKLVVVVADFSSGDPGKGREIADEIAAQIKELQQFGIAVHVLVGEVKPGVIIRSEEMAQDVGRQLPPHTSYVVLWGSMSEMTAGHFRPHITCAYKRSEKSGVSASFTLDLDAQQLPEARSDKAALAERYNRLIGTVCALIPKCYVAHCLNRDHFPDLSAFYSHLGEDKPEVKVFRDEVRSASTWAIHRPQTVLRLSDISEKSPYPQMISNSPDDSVMLLITEKNGQPRIFHDPQKKQNYVIYIDSVEVTNRQFAAFLNAVGNREEKGTTYLKDDPDEEWKYLRPDDSKRFVTFWKSLDTAPVVNVSFIGARAYCDWAQKELPSKDEWIYAATRNSSEYPWGKNWDPAAAKWKGPNEINEKAFPAVVGSFGKDRSPTGCLDMAGNVAEWCFDHANLQDGTRVICGGSWNDDLTELAASKTRALAQTEGKRWVGFRGVRRVYLKE